MRFGIVGDPVSHSRSPAIHNAAFAALGLDAIYEFLPTSADLFPVVIDELRSGDLSGVNVTMPHKGSAYEAVDIRSENAERTGAVNTIIFRDGALYGTNTDVSGVLYAMTVAQIRDDAPVLVFGAGGAAAAAVVASDARQVFVSSRDLESGAQLLERTGVQGSVVPWGEGIEGAVVINATPVGMHGETLPTTPLAQGSAFIDMTYGDQESPSITIAKKHGIPCADGLDMLVGQAFEAFTVFTGQPAPTEVMKSAASQPEV